MLDHIQINHLKINGNNAKIQFIMKTINYELLIERKGDLIEPYSIKHPFNGYEDKCPFCRLPHSLECSTLYEKINDLYLALEEELNKSTVSRLRWITFKGNN